MREPRRCSNSQRQCRNNAFPIPVPSIWRGIFFVEIGPSTHGRCSEEEEWVKGADGNGLARVSLADVAELDGTGRLVREELGRTGLRSYRGWSVGLEPCGGWQLDCGVSCMGELREEVESRGQGQLEASGEVRVVVAVLGYWPS